MEMPEIVVTTTLSEQPEDERFAAEFATLLGGAFIARKDKTLQEFWVMNGVQRVVVVDHGMPICHTPGGHRLFFHPGLAKTRIRFLQQGGHDYMVEALDLRVGDRVLDANLGIANDALVIAFITRAPVIGLEKDPLIAAITAHGLASYSWDRMPEGRVLAPLIRAVHADQRDFLQEAEAASFDSVYFSPMFVKPKRISDDRMPLREIAPKDFVNAEVLSEALRVARRRVVIKLNRDRPQDAALPPGYRMISGKKTYVEYAVYAK